MTCNFKCYQYFFSNVETVQIHTLRQGGEKTWVEHDYFANRCSIAEIMFLKIKFVFGILFWGKRLFAGTVPANKNLFAGTCSGKLELICRNLSSRLTLYFDPRNGFFGQKKWPLGILVFQFVGYNTLYLTWALELLDSWTIVYYKSNEITLYMFYMEFWNALHIIKRPWCSSLWNATMRSSEYFVTIKGRLQKQTTNLFFGLNLVWPIPPWHFGPLVGSNHDFEAIPREFRAYLDNDHMTGCLSGTSSPPSAKTPRLSCFLSLP